MIVTQTPTVQTQMAHLSVYAILVLMELENFAMTQMNVQTTMETVTRMPIASMILVHLVANANLVLMEQEKIVLI